MQVRTTGEAVVEVGVPDGWGPVGLDMKQMDHVLAELEKSLGASGCDVMLLRRRHTHLHSVETAGMGCWNCHQQPVCQLRSMLWLGLWLICATVRDIFSSSLRAPATCMYCGCSIKERAL